MKCAGRGMPTVPEGLFPHPVTGKQTYLCGNASTRGYSCKCSSTECNFAHVLKIQDLPTASRQALKFFIANDVDLTPATAGEYLLFSMY